MKWLMMLLLLTTGCFRTMTYGAWKPEPNLPVFDSGPFTNIGVNELAKMNAVSHVGFSLAIPLTGYYIGGQKAMWYSGLTWIGYSLFEESFYHVPEGPYDRPAYASEVRADLISRIIPTLVLLSVDWWRNGWPWK